MIDDELDTFANGLAGVSRAGGGTRAPSRGLVLDLSADSLALADGTGVQTWPATAPTTISASQGAAADRPTYRTNQINGRPMLDADATDFMQLSSPVNIVGNFTLYLVGKRAAATHLSPLVSFALTDGIILHSGNNIFYLTAVATNNAGVTTSGTVMMRCRRAGGNTLRYASTGQADIAVGGANAGDIRDLTELFGRRNAAQMSTAGNGIARLMLYDRDTVADGDDAAIRSYLASLYNVNL